MSAPDFKSIRVEILGREIGLKVRPGEEDHTRKLAQFVNQRMKQFQRAHPEQAELTTAIITALALAEELYDLHSEREAYLGQLNDDLDALTTQLADALDAETSSVPTPANPEAS